MSSNFNRRLSIHITGLNIKQFSEKKKSARNLLFSEFSSIKNQINQFFPFVQIGEMAHLKKSAKHGLNQYFV
jgi:hypothetical protein